MRRSREGVARCPKGGWLGRGWPRLLVALAVLGVVGLGGIPRVSADNSTSAKELQVERQLGCPICTNLPLNVCDNQICQQMKGIIRQKLSDGETPEQVVDYFVSRYGDAVLLTPPQRGFSLAVWYLPVVGLLAGALVVWAFLRGSVRRQRALDRRLAADDPALDQYRERVRRELRRTGDAP